MTRRPPAKSLRLDDWPPHDLAAWARAVARPGRLTPPGPAARLAEATRDMMIHIYGAYLTWLDERGELDPSVCPEARVTYERLTDFFTDLRQRCSDNTVFNNRNMFNTSRPLS